MRLKPKYSELFEQYKCLTDVQYGETLHRKLDVLYSLMRNYIIDDPKSYEESDGQRR